MKKILVTFLTLSIFILSLGGYVFAADPLMQQKAEFFLVTGGSSNNVTDVPADGNVKIVTPKGRIALIIQGNIKGLEPNREYYVWVRDLAGYTGEALMPTPGQGYYKLLTIESNKKGHASFHISIARADLPAKTYKLQVAINKQTGTDDQVGLTVMATQWPGIDAVVFAK